jgi:hypothetical protein
LPAAASDFSAAIAVKSLVNELVEMLGAAPPEAAADDVPALELLAELELELELEPELPQPATSAAATSVGTMARFQTVIKDSPLDAKALSRPQIAVCLARPGRRQVTVSHGRGRVHPY